jgi:hypothetical protein
MTDDTIVRPDEATSPESSLTEAPAPADDLDSLLSEWDAKVTPQPEPATGAENQQTDQPVDPQSWEDLLGPDPKVAELQGRVDALQTEAHRARELEAFKSFADDLQTQLPSFLPADYAEMKLRSMAHDPVICAAFDLRNVDKSAANLELAKVTRAFLQLQQDPAADPKRLQELRDYGTRLEIAIQSPAILRKARLDILNAANKLPKPIDEDATQVHLDVAAAVRDGGSGRGIPPEPPVQLGRLSDAEYRAYLREIGINGF